MFFVFLVLRVDNGGDFADTPRERAAVMRRSIHVLGILCFRLPALLRCLVTTEREAEREKLWGKYHISDSVSYVSSICETCYHTFLPSRASKSQLLVRVCLLETAQLRAKAPSLLSACQQLSAADLRQSARVVSHLRLVVVFFFTAAVKIPHVV